MSMRVNLYSIGSGGTERLTGVFSLNSAGQVQYAFGDSDVIATEIDFGGMWGDVYYNVVSGEDVDRRVDPEGYLRGLTSRFSGHTWAELVEDAQSQV